MMSGLERLLEFQMHAVGLKNFQPQYRFAAPRRWTFDFGDPAIQLAVEVEGGIWTRGRHTRGSGYEKDCEKYNEACLRGWRVLRFTKTHIKSGTALQTIERAVGASKRLETAS